MIRRIIFEKQPGQKSGQTKTDTRGDRQTHRRTDTLISISLSYTGHNKDDIGNRYLEGAIAREYNEIMFWGIFVQVTFLTIFNSRKKMTDLYQSGIFSRLNIFVLVFTRFLAETPCVFQDLPVSNQNSRFSSFFPGA